MATITRGTTPQLTAKIKDADLQGMDVYLTVGRKDAQPWATVGPEGVTATYDGTDTTVTATLTQEQTLACPVGAGFVQVRAYKDGQAIATGMVPVEVEPVIYNEVLHA